VVTNVSAERLADPPPLFQPVESGDRHCALASLLSEVGVGGLPGLPHAAEGKARHPVQHGAPSQLDLFDYKPSLTKLRGTDLPARSAGQRLTGMTVTSRSSHPSIFRFDRCGQSGIELSELLPHTQKVADQICVVRSLQTEAINHDPAVTFLQTGFQLAGRPSIGAWISYGLGSESQDLPAFVVMVSQGTGNSQALADNGA
jgi:hypothetical protein